MSDQATILKLGKYHSNFIAGLVSLLESSEKQSSELIKIGFAELTELNTNSSRMLNLIRSSGVDEGKLIKKIYTELSENIKFLRTNDIKLFMIQGKSGSRRLIIPGVDIYLIYQKSDDIYRENLWRDLKMIFVSVVRMIHLTNGLEINKEVQEILSEFENELVIKGVKIGDKEFNPFVGVGGDAGNISTDDLFNNVKYDPNMKIEDMAKLMGVDKMMNMDELSEQLKNISPDDIEKASDNIKGLLGMQNNDDASQVITMMLSDITKELKSNDLGGINGIFGIAEKVAKRLTPVINSKNINPETLFAGTKNLIKNGGASNPGMGMLYSMMEKQMESAKPQNANNTNANTNSETVNTDIILNDLQNLKRANEKKNGKKK